MLSPEKKLKEIAKLVRYWIIQSTTEAGSGHPTSSLSATDLMVGLLFGGIFQFNVQKPSFHNNDRLIFSKGHASPLFYSIWAATGAISAKKLLTLRQFGSSLEGHPTMDFPFTEAATGSLGQGLSIGLGMALKAKYIDGLPYRTYVLLGDSEMAEGSVWEALQLATHYKLNNLVGVLDVNRLGQRGETMYGHNIKAYKQRIQSFGWQVITINGHTMSQVTSAYQQAAKSKNKPVMIIAKTLKGKGVPLVEDKDNWHGKALSPEQFIAAAKSLGNVDQKIRGIIPSPKNIKSKLGASSRNKKIPIAKFDEPISTRKAYGQSLVRIANRFPEIVALDGETSNSTFADIFKKAYPKRFFEMYIAEQNMAGAALGLSRRGAIPFVSTFAAFFTRAFDQIRMSQYSDANIKFVGSHAGVSIGEDGASQMALEDLAMFRTLLGSVVLYPSDGVSTDKLVEAAAQHRGIVYIRTTRSDTPILYNQSDVFKIGGSQVVRQSSHDKVTIVAAGITLHEALAAHDVLKKKGLSTRVIDLYSLKPIDTKTLRQAAQETEAIITVEDHYAEGGLGEAVQSALASELIPITKLAVTKMPKSGQAQELLNYEGISKNAIVRAVTKIISSS